MEHLDAVRKVLERAACANLRYKMSKCVFAQWSVPTLGMTAGRGIISADPKKIQGITTWPRPSRLEDLERFLATTVYIRDHPRYSEFAKPLKDALQELQENHKQGRTKAKG